VRTLSLAIILPTYNESENIRDLILAIEELNIEPKPLILVIDDSSPDGTQDIVKNLQKDFNNIMLVVRPCKMGLGTAIREGFKILDSLPNKPKYVITMDADFSHNPKDIPRFLRRAGEGYDIVVGSRYISGGGIRGWTATRIIISGIANRIAKMAIRLPVRDFTSGFRCYSIKYILRAAPKLKSQRFEIQIETLRQAQLMGMKVTEIPITFKNRKRGKSKLTIKEVTNFLFYIIKACSHK
jgi:dolichol-phosphate mannosyltransferase